MKLKEAQTIINMLCERYNIPQIKVILTSIPTSHLAMFDSARYIIEITKDTPKDALIHEFFHYLFTLIHHCEELEEKLADAFANGTKI
jgi:hypothetical protein